MHNLMLISTVEMQKRQLVPGSSYLKCGSELENKVLKHCIKALLTGRNSTRTSKAKQLPAQDSKTEGTKFRGGQQKGHLTPGSRDTDAEADALTITCLSTVPSPARIKKNDYVQASEDSIFHKKLMQQSTQYSMHGNSLLTYNFSATKTSREFRMA